MRESELETSLKGTFSMVHVAIGWCSQCFFLGGEIIFSFKKNHCLYSLLFFLYVLKVYLALIIRKKEQNLLLKHNMLLLSCIKQSKTYILKGRISTYYTLRENLLSYFFVRSCIFHDLKNINTRLYVVY